MFLKKALYALVCVAVASVTAAAKTRIFIVHSYHPEYLWEQDVKKGTIEGLESLGYIDSSEADTLRNTDAVDGSKSVIRVIWLDTKRKSKPAEQEAAAAKAFKEIDAFKPDVVLVSDDNGTKLIGQHYKDTSLPIIFCGLDETPLKYGLVDSMEHPGHNVTGVYQRGFYKEAAQALHQLVPSIKTFAIVGDNSETSKAKLAGIQETLDSGAMPFSLAGKVLTNSYEQWKSEVQKVSRDADAILVINHNTLKDKSGKAVDQMQAGSWYLQHVKKPDFSSEKQFVQEGVLLVAEDSGVKQGSEMVRFMARVLRRGEKPADIAPVHPTSGPIIINNERAQMLGINANSPVVQAHEQKSLALEQFPKG